MNDYKDLIDILCTGGDSQLDASLKPRLQALLTMEPTLQRVKLLEIIDDCVYCSLSSGFVLSALRIIYDDMEGSDETLRIDRLHPEYSPISKNIE